MKKSRFTAEQIVAILQEVANGTPGRQVARKHGITESTLYRWKRVYGGMCPCSVVQLAEPGLLVHLESHEGRRRRPERRLAHLRHAGRRRVQQQGPDYGLTARAPPEARELG